MQDFFDMPTLFFLALALFILWRLRSVLGSRTGTERPPANPYARKKSDKPDAAEDNVIDMPPPQQGVKPPKHDKQTQALKLESEIKRVAEGREEVAEGLKQICESDTSFSPRGFMDGAVSAYEMIVTSFANGDAKTLKGLLDKEVYESFAAEIEAREERNEKIDFTFVGFNDVKMIEARIDKRTVVISIEFNAQVVSATRDENGEIIDGDEVTVVNIADEWTFSRGLRSRDPNWKLVATNQLS
ncbi:MAG: Tim44 domain-containing protein [Alphaproteobacteria bacterium]|nr:Tim44 domain-containing protein [Alphaproteobacteria bacterium]